MTTSALHTEPAVAPPQGRARSLKRRWLAGSLVLLAIAGAAAAQISLTRSPRQESARAPAQPKAVPVAAARAKPGDVDVYIDALGSVTPLNTVTVRSRLDGELTSVRFTEGQMVHAGELLAEVDPRALRVQLEQAEAQLARDDAMLRNARADLERYRSLHEKRLIPVQQLDTQASLVRQHEATLRMSQAAVDSAKLQLSYSRVVAPLAGRAGLRQVDQGNVVRANDANGIVVITQLQPISVVFSIPEDRVRAVMKKLQSGEKLAVEALDRAGKTKLATGQLLTVDNQIDPATGTVKLKAQFANADFALFPNQFVNVRMLLDVDRGAVVIPSAAVQRGTQGTFVYAVDGDNAVEMRPVTLGAAHDGLVAVASGLAAGEVVVVDGADKLRQGTHVELAAADDATEAKPHGKKAKSRSAKAPAGPASGG
jgi:multidrug efflux system membrane fusion protein